MIEVWLKPEKLTSNFVQRHTAVQMKNLTLTIHLFKPLIFAELLTETVRYTVRCDLVTSSVEGLNLSIIGPFMTKEREREGVR